MMRVFKQLFKGSSEQTYQSLAQNTVALTVTDNKNLQSIIIQNANDEDNNEANNLFDKLPTEMMPFILDYLDILSFSRFGQTHIRAREIVNDINIRFFSIPVIKRPIDVSANVEVRQATLQEVGKFSSYYNTEVNPYAGRANEIKWKAYKYLGTKSLAQGRGSSVLATLTGSMLAFCIMFGMMALFLKFHNHNSNKEYVSAQHEVDYLRLAPFFTLLSALLATLPATISCVSSSLFKRKPAYKQSVKDRLDFAEKLKSNADPEVQSHLPKIEYRRL